MQHQPATWVSSVAQGKIGNDHLLLMGAGEPCVLQSVGCPASHLKLLQQQLVELLESVYGDLYPEPAHQQLWLPCRLPV